MNSATDKGIAESLKVGATIPLEEYKQPEPEKPEEILQKIDNFGARVAQSVNSSNGPEFVTLLDVNNVYTLEKWDKRILRGLVRRIGPHGRKWLELSSERPSWITLTAIHCPRVASNESLKIHLPLLVIMMKQMFKRPFAFQISIVDSRNEVRRFMICTPIHSTFLDENKILWVPLQLEKGWNLVEIDLEDFNYQAFGTHFKYVDRIQIHPNCLLKEVYFQNRYNNRNIMGNIQQQQSIGIEGPENFGFDMNQNQLLEMQMMIQKNQELLNANPQKQFEEKLSPIALMQNAGLTEPNLMSKLPEGGPFLSDESYSSMGSQQQRALITPQQRTLIEQAFVNSPPAIEQLYNKEEQQAQAKAFADKKCQSKKSDSIQTPMSAKKQKELEEWPKHRKMKSPFPIFSPPKSSAIETKKDIQEQEIKDLTEELRNVLMQKQMYNKELSERTSSEILENYLKQHVISPATCTDTPTTTTTIPTPVSTITNTTTAKDTDTNNNLISSDSASYSNPIKPAVNIKKTDSIAFYKLIKDKLREYALTRVPSTTSEVEAQQLELLGEFLEKQISRQDLDEDWETEYQKNLSTRLTDFFDREKQIRKAEKVSNIKRRIVSGIREKAKVCDRKGPSLTVNVSNSKNIPAKKKIRRNTNLVQPPHGFLIPAMTQEEYQMKMQMEEYKRNPGHKIKCLPINNPNKKRNPSTQTQSQNLGSMEKVERKETEIEIHMGANKVKKFNKSSKIYIGILDTIKRADTVWKGIEEEKIKKQQELEDIKRLEVRKNNLALTQ